jgi:hypothetical protein
VLLNVRVLACKCENCTRLDWTGGAVGVQKRTVRVITMCDT